MKNQDMIKAMKTYGGSFVKSLATTMCRADLVNYKKLVKAFPEYCALYCGIAEEKRDELQGQS